MTRTITRHPENRIDYAGIVKYPDTLEEVRTINPRAIPGPGSLCWSAEPD